MHAWYVRQLSHSLALSNRYSTYYDAPNHPIWYVLAVLLLCFKIEAKQKDTKDMHRIDPAKDPAPTSEVESLRSATHIKGVQTQVKSRLLRSGDGKR